MGYASWKCLWFIGWIFSDNHSTMLGVETWFGQMPFEHSIHNKVLSQVNVLQYCGQIDKIRWNLCIGKSSGCCFVVELANSSEFYKKKNDLVLVASYYYEMRYCPEKLRGTSKIAWIWWHHCSQLFEKSSQRISKLSLCAFNILWDFNDILELVNMD